MSVTATAAKAPDGVQQIKAICRMCHGGCGTIVTLRDGVVTKVVGDPDNPINQGKLCIKAGRASIDQLYNPARLHAPLLRIGPKGSGQWQEVSWDAAIDHIANRLIEIRSAYGAEAVTFARGVSMNNNQIVSRLANLFGTPNIASINYYCYGPRVAACAATSSGRFSGREWDTVAIADVYNNPNCLVEWGSQKRISNDHGLIGHVPMTQALKRNPFSIVVDPRKPAAAGPADIWLPLRPGTDAAMALGWMNVIIEEGLYDADFVEGWCHGFDALRERVRDYPVDRVAEITWCNADDIRAAARQYATLKPATIAWGTGADHIGINATQANRSIHLLMGLTGNLDVPGGNCFWPGPRLADTELWDKLPQSQIDKRIGAERFKALRGRPTAYAHPPSVFQTILSDEPYPIKAMLVFGNNPATCYPNTRLVMRALARLDLLVVSEIFMTPTAAIADVVLPAASNLERDDPRLYMHIKGPTGTFMDAATRAAVTIAERRSDWDMIVALGQKLGYGAYFQSSDAIAAEALAPMGVTWPELKSRDYVVEPMRFRKYMERGFGTPTGKFELYSTLWESWGYDPLPAHVEPIESPVRTPEIYAEFPLILNTGVRQPMYWNSNGHPLPSLRSLQPEPLMEIHPDTAARFGLCDKAYAWVETRVGRLRMKVRTAERSHPDVVSIPHGWWQPDAAGPDHGVYEVCANVLTDDSLDGCDPILGSSPLKALLCRVFPDQAPPNLTQES